MIRAFLVECEAFLEKDLVQFAMCGDSGRYSPYTAVRSLDTQRILLLINSAPSRADDISVHLDLGKEKVHRFLSALSKCGLINESDGKISPSFPIFTAKDQVLLEPIIKKLAHETAAAVQKRMNEVESLIDDLSLTERGLRFSDLEYIIIGALTLDYNGLRVLREERLLCPGKKMPGKGNYIFSGLECGLVDLKKGWMWGHNSGFGRYWFSSHGRVPKDFRMAFPDLAWQWVGQVEQSAIVAEMEKTGQILEALSQEDLSLVNLKDRIGRNDELLAQLAMLLGLGYVVLADKKWRINRPFFTVDDLGKIRKVSELILREVAKFLKGKQAKMLEGYAHTLPSKNEIPFEEAFNLIYHLIFEQALDLMMRNRTFDPPLRHSNGRYSPFVAVSIESC